MKIAVSTYSDGEWKEWKVEVRFWQLPECEFFDDLRWLVREIRPLASAFFPYVILSVLFGTVIAYWFQRFGWF